MDTKVFQRIVDQDVIDEELDSLIVIRNIPSSLVEWPEFHVLCRVLIPESEDYIITAHASVPKKIEQSWQKLQKAKKLWEEYWEKAPNYMVMQSYERNTKELDDFDRIAQDWASLLGRQAKMDTKITILSRHMRFARVLSHGGVRINSKNVGQACHIWRLISYQFQQ
ncbi:hypothetical protein ETB97_005509 [Aspergillus alliaceus]|uniref:Uncharacterized protein n=1 Tax=Petromyces alliaceus TaxID=209559 RepID=A0A8H6E329_PETAA|nr:hypothetical protein ETB97_005509 [Aspergillus burnettii]